MKPPIITVSSKNPIAGDLKKSFYKQQIGRSVTQIMT